MKEIWDVFIALVSGLALILSWINFRRTSRIEKPRFLSKIEFINGLFKLNIKVRSGKLDTEKLYVKKVGQIFYKEHPIFGTTEPNSSMVIHVYIKNLETSQKYKFKLKTNYGTITRKMDKTIEVKESKPKKRVVPKFLKRNFITDW